MASLREAAARRARPARRHPLTSRLSTHLRTPLFQTAYALMLTTILTSGLGLVYWVLAARLYAADVVGLNSALISTMLFLSGVSQLNLRSALNRFIPVAGRSAPRLVAIAYVATVPVTFMAVLAYFGLVRFLAPQSTVAASSHEILLVSWFLLATATWGIFNMQDGVLTGLRLALLLPFENTAYALAKIVLLVVFAGPLAVYGVFASWTVPVLLIVAAVSVFLFGRALPRTVARAPTDSTFHIRRVVRFVTGDYIGALFVLAYTSLLPVMVISVVGSAAAAHFYIVWIITTSLNLFPLSMSISHTVETVASGADPMREARSAMIHMARTLIPIVAIVIVGAPYILAIFGSDYAEAGTDLLRLLALGVLPYAVNVMYFSLARIRTRVRGIVAAQATLAISTITLSMLLLGPFGLLGVGIAWVVSQSVVALFALTFALRPAIGRGITG